MKDGKYGRLCILRFSSTSRISDSVMSHYRRQQGRHARLKGRRGWLKTELWQQSVRAVAHKWSDQEILKPQKTIDSFNLPHPI